MKPTLLLGAMMVAFAAYFGYHVVYLPQQAERRQVPVALDQEQANQRAQAEVAAIARSIESFRRRLPPEADASWLVNQVPSLANEAGVQVTRMVPEPLRDMNGVTRLGVELQVTATYHQLGAFLDRLERAAVFIRVDRVDLDHTAAAEPSSQRAARVILSTLYVPPLSLGTPAMTSSAPAPGRVSP